jgi:ankyrin repeat protein
MACSYGVVTAGEIHVAAAAGDAERVQTMLESDARLVDARDDDGRSPLHIAAIKGHLRVAEVLLNHGAAVDAVHRFAACPWCQVSRGDDTATPLLYAVEAGHGELAALLVTHQANAAWQSLRGASVLGEAVAREDTAILENLIAHGIDVPATDQQGSTLLERAIKDHQLGSVKVLLSAGARVNVKRLGGRTVLHFAAQGGQAETVELLLRHGADARATADDGRTPLHVAALGCVEVLLAHGADVNAKDGAGRTPISYAAENGADALVAKLAERGAALGVFEAAILGTTDLLGPILAQRPAAVRDRDGHQRTPLHYAASRGQVAVAEMLLAAGADPNAHDEHGVTPLELAVEAGSPQLVETLLAHHANPDPRLQGGSSERHAADVDSKETRPVVPPVERPLDRAGSLAALEQACFEGAVKACALAGAAFERGLGVAEDPARSLRLYDKGCAGGHLEACETLALMYAGGRGAAKDTPRAAKILARACDAGRGESCRALAKLGEPPRVVALSDSALRGSARPAPVELSPGQRVDLLEQACWRGVNGGCVEAADMLTRWPRMRHQPERAAQLRLRACLTDPEVYSEACLFAANHFRDPDPTLAARLYQKACEKAVPNANACLELAALATAGRGAARDLSRAASLYRKACDAGDARGCTRLGEAYQAGEGVPLDAAQAAPLYEKACGRPMGEAACFLLARLYETGAGIARDAAKAHALYGRACDEGEPRGCEALRQLGEDPTRRPGRKVHISQPAP